MTNSEKPSRDDVLASFAVEEDTGPSTLKRYLATYPEFARDLVQVSREMRRSWSDDEPLSAEQQASLGAAMQRLVGAPGALTDLSSAPPSVFGVAADLLGLPLQVLAAIRQRRVEPASVPPALMARFAEALKTSAAQLLSYLAQPPLQAVQRSAKADGKPAEPTKVGIERLLVDAGVPQDQIEELMR